MGRKTEQTPKETEHRLVFPEAQSGYTFFKDGKPEPGRYVIVQVDKGYEKGPGWGETWFELLGVDNDGNLFKKKGKPYNFVDGAVPVAWKYIDVSEDTKKQIDVEL